MTIEPGTESLEEHTDNRFADPPEYESPEENELIDSLLSILGNFVVCYRYREDKACARCFHIAHYSVQEYFTSDYLAEGDLKWFSLKKAQADRIILDACLTHLQWNDLRKEDGDVDLPLTRKPRVAREKGITHLYDTICHDWVNHVQNEKHLLEEAAILLAPFPHSAQYRSWQYVHSSRAYTHDPQNESIAASPIYYMAYFGFPETVRRMIERGDPAMSAGGRFGYPLHAAAARGHVDVMKVLIDFGKTDPMSLNDLFYHGVPVRDIPGEAERRLKPRRPNSFPDSETWGKAPIHLAALERCLNTLRFLIDHTVDVSVRSSQGYTAWEYAIKQDEDVEEVLKIFIDKGINISSCLRFFVPFGLESYDLESKGPLLRKLLDLGLGADPNYPGSKTLLYKCHRRLGESRLTTGYYRDTFEFCVWKEIVDILHEYGAEDPEISPLELALVELTSSKAVERAILRGEDIEYSGPSVEKAREEVISTLESTPSDFSRDFVCCGSAVDRAIMIDDVVVLRKMVDIGLDIHSYLVVHEQHRGVPTLMFSMCVCAPRCYEYLREVGLRLQLSWSMIELVMCSARQINDNVLAFRGGCISTAEWDKLLAEAFEGTTTDTLSAIVDGFVVAIKDEDKPLAQLVPQMLEDSSLSCEQEKYDRLKQIVSFIVRESVVNAWESSVHRRRRFQKRFQLVA